MDSVICKEVIISTIRRRGDGTPNNPIRMVVEVFEKDGTLIAERDTFDTKVKWVSVKERLPEESGRYWCYIEHQTDLGLSHFQWNCSYNEIEKTFSDSSLKDGEKVTHWTKLLPKPNK